MRARSALAQLLRAAIAGAGDPDDTPEAREARIADYEARVATTGAVWGGRRRSLLELAQAEDMPDEIRMRALAGDRIERYSAARAR